MHVHIRIKDTFTLISRSMDKDKDDPRTGKRCSAERQEMFHRNSTVTLRLAASRNPHRISAEFVGFCKVSCDMYRILLYRHSSHSRSLSLSLSLSFFSPAHTVEPRLSGLNGTKLWPDK